VIDHLDLNVSDLQRSREFYEPLLRRLGYTPFDAGTGWCSFIEPNRRFYLVLVQTPLDHLHSGFHRKRIGVNHLAFAAPDRVSVDDLHAWLGERAIVPLYGGPKQMGDRYAIFFEDPDRLKVEYVHRPD
jgi:catechol 2,3-dioxygenase-like lactoylglutathione lyase family enzyme